MAKRKIWKSDFTHAKFNNFNKENMQHTSIVTSTGRFLVTWDLDKVLKGAYTSYVIKPIKNEKSKGNTNKKIVNKLIDT